MKKGQMYAFHLEIEEWKRSGSVLMYFNRSRINDFYKEFGIRIQSLFKEIEELQKKYYVIEENKLKIEDGKPVLIDPEKLSDANQAWQDLMNQNIVDKIILSNVR